MCGIAGLWSPNSKYKRAQLEAAVQEMMQQLVHRGPDSHGVWARAASGIALGHRRLSIIDLSPHGHQPMTSRDGRYVIAYNGEIYNFERLRAKLHGPWRGHSDTEVAVEAIAAWGFEDALKEFVGMFAIAVWDRQTQTLSLARDRMGIKPLYWGKVGDRWAFASEPKAIQVMDGFDADIDRDALAAYMRFNCVPAPLSIWRGLHQLEPGHWVQISADGAQHHTYWTARDAAIAGLDNPMTGSDDHILGQLETVLGDAVEDRMIADVPLGAFLSGGVDSSAIVALMQARSAKPVQTFSIGFHDAAYNEAENARAVAKHLGTKHTDLYVTPDQTLDVVGSLPSMYSEPFSDSSQIPTFLVSQLARKHVTVSLSGDGGDELFGGYNRHVFGPKVLQTAGRFPMPVRTAISHALGSVPARAWDGVFQAVESVGGIGVRLPTEKVQKLAGVLTSESSADMYGRLTTHWRHVVRGAGDAYQPRPFERGQFAEQMMLLDMENYLVNDILTKVDRASMAVSLEARVPLLDHRVVEFAWRMPLHTKIRDGVSKWALRQVLYKYVPKTLIERPKMGFGVPIDAWLRGPLKEWAWELLRPERLKREGFLRADLVLEKWEEHQKSAKNWQHHLWDVLMFQSWLEHTRST